MNNERLPEPRAAAIRNGVGYQRTATSVRQGAQFTQGPIRVAAEQPPQDWQPYTFLGFAPPEEEAGPEEQQHEADPVTWDGDQA
jgi:hypothetical protein